MYRRAVTLCDADAYVVSTVRVRSCELRTLRESTLSPRDCQESGPQPHAPSSQPLCSYSAGHTSCRCHPDSHPPSIARIAVADEIDAKTYSAIIQTLRLKIIAPFPPLPRPRPASLVPSPTSPFATSKFPSHSQLIPPPRPPRLSRPSLRRCRRPRPRCRCRC